MSFAFFFTLAGLAALFVYIREKLKGCTIKALIEKSIVSALFIAVGFSALYASPSRCGLFVLAGLVCGILGDIWLDLKYIYPEDDAPYTFSGFISFAIGHVLFISGMLLDFGSSVPGSKLLLVSVAAIVLGFATVLSAPLMGLNYGKYRGISLMYGPLLFGTALVSLLLCLTGGFENTGLLMMLVGGVLFALSDLVLSGTYFGEGKNRPVDIILNYVFYYGAQFTIALSILFF